MGSWFRGAESKAPQMEGYTGRSSARGSLTFLRILLLSSGLLSGLPILHRKVRRRQECRRSLCAFEGLGGCEGVKLPWRRTTPIRMTFDITGKAPGGDQVYRIPNQNGIMPGDEKPTGKNQESMVKLPPKFEKHPLNWGDCFLFFPNSQNRPIIFSKKICLNPY